MVAGLGDAFEGVRKEEATKEISFTVPGPPQGKARARTFYNPALQRMQSITPGNTVLYENLVKLMYQNAAKGESLDDGPISATIECWFQPPKSCSKKQLAAMLDGKSFPQKKPDLDNIIKIILDALNKVAYPDDKAVVAVTATKGYAEEARVDVRLEVMELGG